MQTSRFNPSRLLALIVVIVALAAPSPAVAQEPALSDMGQTAPPDGVLPGLSEQSCAGEYSSRIVNTRTDQPVVGATVTVLETGFATTTDSNGEYRVRIPGPGLWTIRSTHPDYTPFAIRIEVSASTCQIVSRTVVEGGGPSASAPPPSTTASTSASSAHQFFGALSIEGRPAPSGTTVIARVGETECGRQRTTSIGQYRVTVDAASVRAGCGRNGSAVQFAVIPAFGSGWRLSATATFARGGSTQREISVDLRTLPPVPENVPWNSPWWDTRTIAIGACGSFTPTVRDAINGALQQWRAATASQGLNLTLVADGRKACDESQPGIAIIQDDIDNAGALAVAVSLDSNLESCRRGTACWAFKGVIFIDPTDFGRLNPLDRANVVAHEIGHTLGLGHALNCTGGTIMWADTDCRFPLSNIGADDIASLNTKLDASVGPLTETLTERAAAPLDALSGSAVRSAWPTLDTAVMHGDVTRLPRRATE